MFLIWLDLGHTREELIARAQAAPKFEAPAGSASASGPLIKTSAEFVRGFIPPDYVVVGILQRRFLYALTGKTGSGKTSKALLLAASAAQGIPFGGHQTKKTRVLYAAAENPTDVRMRWIALAAETGFDRDTIEVFFTDQRFSLSAMLDTLRAEAEQIGGEFGLVVIDTNPAFFEGDDENSRAQMQTHAMYLRRIIEVIPGGPCVVANCHPTKNVVNDNLLPAGGGTFLNEIDGNLTSTKNDSITELHHIGKFRGPEFAPINFQFKTVTHPEIVDGDGRLLPTVLCEYLSEQGREEIEANIMKEEDAVLELFKQQTTKKITLVKIAELMGWATRDGRPNKSQARRRVDALMKAKLIKKVRGGWEIIKKRKPKED
jgi:hypothetical protein